MPFRLRLMRFGKKNLPFYRIVAIDSRRSAKSGAFREILGTYDPIPDNFGNKFLRINSERAKYWIAVGAQPSETVAKILSSANLLPPFPPRIPINAMEYLLAHGRPINRSLPVTTRPLWHT